MFSYLNGFVQALLMPSPMLFPYGYPADASSSVHQEEKKILGLADMKKERWRWMSAGGSTDDRSGKKNATKLLLLILTSFYFDIEHYLIFIDFLFIYFWGKQLMWFLWEATLWEENAHRIIESSKILFVLPFKCITHDRCTSLKDMKNWRKNTGIIE